MAGAEQVTSGDLGAEFKRGSYAGTWTLDPSRSTVGLKTKAMWGVVPVKGTFSDLAGTAEVSSDGVVTGQVRITSDSINTKMKKRDEHLRSDDFFSAATYPEILFDLDSAAPAAGTLAASGRLTVRDKSIPLTFPATVSALATGEVTLDAEVTVDRSQLGIDFKSKGATKMENTLALHAVFTRG
jgi:polyisoprenoid-binding protein YceI